MALFVVVAGPVLGVVPEALHAQVAGEVRGVVVESGSNVLIGGARVEVVGTTFQVRTGPDGRFILRGMEPGSRALRVRAIGFAPLDIVVTSRTGTSEVVQLVMTRTPLVIEDVVVSGERSVLTGAQVIRRGAIDSSGARDLGELLEGHAGLLVIRSGGASSPTTLSIRGGNADQVLVLLDGAPLNDPVTGVTDLSTIPLSAVEQVAVFKGAASARYGARAMTGVVAIESRQTAKADLAARLEVGSFGDRVLGGHLGGGTGWGHRRFHGLLVVEGRRTDGDFSYQVPAVRGGGEAQRVNADAELATGYLTGAVVTDRTELRARVEVMDIDRGIPGPVTQPTPSSRQRQTRVGGVVTGHGRWGGWQVGANVTGRWQETEYRDTAPPGRPPYDDSVRVAEQTIQLEVDGPVGAAGMTLGAEYRRQQFDGTTLSLNAPSGSDYAGVWTMMTGGWGVGRSTRLDVHGAIRADRTSRLTDVIVSPRVGATLSNGSVAFRLSWGQAYSPPTLADQFFQEGVLVEPNPDLGPERIVREWQVGLSMLQTLTGAIDLTSDAALYWADVEGMILWLPDFRFVWSPNNFDVTRRGLDVTARLKHRGNGAELRATYSLVAVEYAGPVLSGQVAYRPRHLASGGIGIPYRWLRTDMDVRYVGDRRTVPGSSLNSLPAYVMVDLGVVATLRMGSWTTEAFVRIENLMNTSAALLADYPLPGRAVRVGWRLGQ